MMLLARLGLRSVEVARLELEDSTGAPASWWSRQGAPSADRCRCPRDVGEALVGYLSLRGSALAAGVLDRQGADAADPRRAESANVVRARACARASRTSARTVCATRSPASCCARARRWSTSARCCATATWRPRRSTPRSISARLRQVARPWPGARDERVRWARLEDYLRLRRMLGYKLDDAARQLPWFVDYLDATGSRVRDDRPRRSRGRLSRDSAAGQHRPGRRMIGRARVRALHGRDRRRGPRCRRPAWSGSRGAGGRRSSTATPTCVALMEQARRSIREPLRAATYETLLGLLAATGLRIGEALRLDRGDIDAARRRAAGPPLEVRQVAPGAAAGQHASRRSSATSTAAASSTRTPGPTLLRVAARHPRLIYECVWPTFRRLCTRPRSAPARAVTPRIHDLRHAFAVHTLLDWYRAGVDVQSRLRVAVDLSRPRRTPLHVLLPLGRARAARARRPARSTTPGRSGDDA